MHSLNTRSLHIRHIYKRIGPSIKRRINHTRYIMKPKYLKSKTFQSHNLQNRSHFLKHHNIILKWYKIGNTYAHWWTMHNKYLTDNPNWYSRIQTSLHLGLASQLHWTKFWTGWAQFVLRAVSMSHGFHLNGCFSHQSE